MTKRPTAASDYVRVERAIRYLDEHHLNQPALSELAGVVGLSEFHFQRLFHRWVGVTPKSFLQYATLSHAKHLLQQSRTLFDSSLEVGLSGPSRLHDLFINLEAMTPGEYKLGARGLSVRWGIHSTPFGEAIFAATDRGLCGLSFIGDDPGRAVEDTRRQWPEAHWNENPTFTEPFSKELSSRCSGQPPRPLSLLLKGTAFQVKVWEALLRVPEGTVTSYAGLAEMLNAPQSSRAVGAAVAANPIGYVIPCHRVIRSTGVFGGYHWGERRKRTILAFEQVRLGLLAGHGGGGGIPGSPTHANQRNPGAPHR